MANTKQARKRARQNVVRRERNVAERSMLRTFVKHVLKAIQAKQKEAAVAAYRILEPKLDRAACKGIFHKNKVARHKMRLHAAIKALG